MVAAKSSWICKGTTVKDGEGIKSVYGGSGCSLEDLSDCIIGQILEGKGRSVGVRGAWFGGGCLLRERLKWKGVRIRELDCGSRARGRGVRIELSMDSRAK
ncbi:hypothetical protein MRB53_014186 [Persea americana]|uniref:Uncharacterized protein n=1 Tax=Persea americana TaxID=3435 RepID=A0ACC2KA65_PERAE|nr:hypothetical protein MRB53_014186 [Persea americana]